MADKRHIYRVVAVYPENQTVDLVPSMYYQGFESDSSVKTGAIIHKVPYISSSISDQGSIYEWTRLLAKDVNKSFENNSKQYKQSFAFGHFRNPAYFKFTYENYYKNKGTNPKNISGGVTYRPEEGSLAIYDSDLGMVLGFTSGDMSIINPIPNIAANDIPPEFNMGYHTALINIHKMKDIIPGFIASFASSIGYYKTLQIKDEVSFMETNRDASKDSYPRDIDALSLSPLQSGNYPIVPNNLWWQSLQTAHAEPLTPSYIRGKQDEFKRLCDVYGLQTKVKGYINRAFKPREYLSTIDPTYPLFTSASDFAKFNPKTNTLSISNFWLGDRNIFDNFVTDDDVKKNIASYKQKTYKEATSLFKYEDDTDVHIIPESGIRHSRDGKIHIFADVSRTHADNTKPLDFSEFYNQSSDFYNNIYSYYKTYLHNFKSVYSSNAGELYSDSSVLGVNKYYFDTFRLDTPEKLGKKQINSVAERGSYFTIDPSYIELSSDSVKGGFLLLKSSRSYEWHREYCKSTIMMPFETFRTHLAENSNVYLNFDHPANGQQTDNFCYQIFTNDKIREGTWALEAPLVGTKSWRTYNKAIRSYVIEVEEGGAVSHSAGIYVGVSNGDSNDITPPSIEGINLDLAADSPPPTSTTNDGGIVWIRAGAGGMSGTLPDAMTKASESGTGRIILEAGEIEIRTPRFMWGPIRDDQKTRMAKLNLGEVALSLVPAVGQALKNAGKALYQWYPVRNEFPYSSIM